MKGYKGFSNDFRCLNFQYEVGKTYEMEDDIKLCTRGFHFCENPKDVFNYYPAVNGNRFCEINAEYVSNEMGSDSKRVCRKITIIKELSVREMCELAAKYTETSLSNDKILLDEFTSKRNNGCFISGYSGFSVVNYKGYSESGSFGISLSDEGSISASDYSGISVSGHNSISKSENVGYSETKDFGVSVSGKYGMSKSDYSGVSLSGIEGSSVSGDYGISNSQNKGCSSTGRCGIAMSVNGKVKGKIGSILIVRNVEFDWKGNPKLLDYAMAVVDGVEYKPYKWYKLENGKLVEA